MKKKCRMWYSHIVNITNRMSSAVRKNVMKSKQTKQTNAWKNRKSDLFAIHRFLYLWVALQMFGIIIVSCMKLYSREMKRNKPDRSDGTIYTKTRDSRKTNVTIESWLVLDIYHTSTLYRQITPGRRYKKGKISWQNCSLLQVIGDKKKVDNFPSKM